MVDERKKSLKRNIKIACIVVLCMLVIGTPLFTYFRITIDGRVAYREAKNIKLAFDMMEIEYYAQRRSVFDASAPNGMSKGVQERLDEILEHDSDVSILAYDKSNRRVSAFVYTNGHYRVLYHYDAVAGENYEVDFMFRILEYNGK